MAKSFKLAFPTQRNEDMLLHMLNGTLIGLHPQLGWLTSPQILWHKNGQQPAAIDTRLECGSGAGSVPDTITNNTNHGLMELMQQQSQSEREQRETALGQTMPIMADRLGSSF